eukprot:TRINITY_DN39288_c0_g1_i1.p1 TRINITY_DN39288_c0_g1~~TRINITY_DN39288_c0_g1_i1.p1  ORF type:complete len:300 (+),score=72.94 TRINITY_DN39288_c0_g1_i1:69-902(+)
MSARPAALLIRHSEREDYCSEDKAKWVRESKRPWDSPLTERGLAAAKLTAEKRLLPEKLSELGVSPVKRIYSSPFLRCVQTAAEFAKVLGIDQIMIEEGVAESCHEGWARQWGVPGANTKWGGPPGCTRGVPVAEADLHPLVFEPLKALMSPRELREHVPLVNADHETFMRWVPPSVRWGQWETLENIGARVSETVAARFFDRPDETAVFVSHNGACFRGAAAMTSTPVPPPTFNPGYLAIYAAYPTPGEEGSPSGFEPHKSLWGCATHTEGLGLVS